MEKIILIIMAIFFVLGAMDYVLENKFGLGVKFKEGIDSMGVLALSMTGLLALSPLIGSMIKSLLGGLNLGIDMSIFPSMLLAIDMGALSISNEIASSSEMTIVSGVIIASTFGATLSFSIPLALGIVKKENSKFLIKGIIYGIATMPVATIISGVLLKMNFVDLLINLIPLFLFSGILIIGMLKFEIYAEKLFAIFSKGIFFISLGAFVLLGVNSILGYELIKGLIPVEEAIVVVGKIGIFLAGAYPFLEFIKKFFANLFIRVSKILSINLDSAINLCASTISNVMVFQNFDKLDNRGKVICSAFSVSGAFVFGGQLGFVAAEVPEYVGVYIISKVVAGICAILVSIFMFSKNKVL